MKYRLKNGIYYDNNGNSASIEYFSGGQKAIQALDSLVDCSNCSNCFNCSDCFNCSNCVDCYACVYCVYCFSCHNRSDYYSNKPMPVKPPKIKSLHQKVLASASKENALHMDQWVCDTAMCHGGWIVHHGGKTGQKLLEETDYCFAAMQIAKASGVPVNPSMFFVSDEDGLKNIEMLAQRELLK